MKRYLFAIILIFCSLATLATPPAMPTSIITLADGSVAIANKGTKTVEIYSADFSEKNRTLTFNDPPQGITQNTDGTLFVTTFNDGQKGIARSMLHRIGTSGIEKSVTAPYGAGKPIIAAGKLYLGGQFDGTVAQFNPQTLDQEKTTHVLREPKALVANDKYLFVLNFLPATASNLDYVACDVSVIDLATFQVVKNIKLSNGSNALRDILLTRDGRYVLVSHNLGRYTVPTSQLQQGWMNTSAVSVIDAKNLIFKGSIIVDEPNRGAAGTWGIAQGGANGEKIIVSHSGTHDVSIIDYKKMIDKLENYKGGIDMLDYDLRFLYGMRDRVALTGNGPRAMSISKDGTKVYVPTYFSDTLNIVRIDSHDIKTVALNPERTMSQAQIGEKVFNDATYCFQNWQSCNGCHPGEARTDGMNWDLMNDGIGNSKNCKSLLYSIQTAPSMISGIRASAELANRKGFTHIQFSNIPEEMALAVDAYTRTLEAVASPFLVNGQLSEKAKAGSKVFEKFNCGQCHSGPYYTDMKMHRIGEDIEFEAGWDTPTLREVWRTAPYLFNGRAVTMRDVFAVYKHGIDRKISDREIDELTEYVNSL
ncbi:MAG: YVTN family beta-propeller repeat-containing protein [Mucinivorans sp.]